MRPPTDAPTVPPPDEDLSALLASVGDGAALLRAVFTHTPTPFSVFGADGHLVAANRAYRAMFGSLPPPEYSIFRDEVCAALGITDLVRRAFAGEAVRTPAFWYDPRALSHVTVTDANRVAISCTVFPLRGDDGAVTHVAIAYQDVTAELLARERAEAERARLLEILRQAPAAISIRSGPQLVFTLVNSVYQEIAGTRALLGRASREALPELDGQGVHERLTQVYLTGEPWRGTEVPVWLERDGAREERVFNLTYLPLRGADGAVESVVTFSVEVTEHVRARRAAEEANRAKDEFLAMLGHELRNPLSPILTALELMKLRDPTAFARERTVIERQVRHVVRLVDDLLDVSRVTRGLVTLAPERVAVGDVVTAAVELASPLLERQAHRLHLEVPPELWVYGDPTRLGQVFANLLSNAAKYTPRGGDVAVSARAVDDRVRITVADTGVGIGAEMLPRVFDQFVQERQPLDRAAGGLGLGLAIVRSIVALHGGTVTAHSEGVGRGAAFTVELPRMLDHDASPKEIPPPAAPRRVLVVDDASTASRVADWLRGVGYVVRVATDGPDALAALPSFAPDVALVALTLPVMEAAELARRIHAQPAFASLPLVAVAAYGQSVDPSAVRAQGFADLVARPLEPASLASRLAAQLRPAGST